MVSIISESNHENPSDTYDGVDGRRITRLRNLTWPSQVRCTVNITLDFDAQLARRAASEPRMELTEGEFGGRTGIWRIFDMCSRHDVKLTVFAPGRICDLYPDALREAASRGFELADHFWEHRLPQERHLQREHLLRTKDALTSLAGVAPVGHRGGYSLDDLVDNGFVYESLSSADDMPYLATKGGRTIVCLPTSEVLDDAMYWKFGWAGSEPAGQRITDAETVEEIWLESFREVHERGGYLNLVLHDLMAGRGARVVMLDRLLGTLRRAGGVWFPSCAEVARHVLDQQRPAA